MIEPIKHNDISDGQKKSMKSRTITAIVLAVICVPCLFIGSWAFFILAAFMTGASAYEIMKAGNYHKYKYKYFILVFGFIIMYSLVFWIFIKNNLAVYNANPNDFHFSLENGFNTVWVSTIAVVICAIVLFFNCLLDDYYTILDVCYHIAMFIFVSIAIQSFMFLRYNPFLAFAEDKYNGIYDAYVSSNAFKYCFSAFLIIFAILGTIGNDIGAYFTGVLFGKTKINPRISPKKTWEGFVGGCVFSTLFSFGFAMICSACGTPIHPELTVEKWYWILLISICLPLVGTIGDFAFSAIKRFFDIKDFSHLLKEHGGVLDRIDSLLFTSVTVAIFVVFLNNGWNFLV